MRKQIYGSPNEPIPSSHETLWFPTDRLSDADFNAIAARLRDITGITLAGNKKDLVFGRLNKRLRNLGLKSFSDYIAFLDTQEGEGERGEMINALTTNLTAFFREGHHFKHLAEEVLPEIIRGGSNRIRVWSAACSSGEEPYSISMVLQKALASRPQWDARVLATDIDTNMVETARAGIYPADRIAAIPPDYAGLLKPDADGSAEMPEAIKRRITFNPLNLLGEWPMRGRFDVIFCRNVVIYFDKDTQRILFDRMADILQPRGWLFIGHSESLFRVTDRFESLGRTMYRKLR